jgi:hypothetical protein
VENAVNVIVEWVKNVLQQTLSLILDPLWRIIEDYQESILKCFSSFTDTVDIKTAFENALDIIITHPINLLLMSLSFAIISIEVFLNIVVSVFTGGMSNLATMVIGMILPSITSEIGKALISFVIGAAIGYILDKIVPQKTIEEKLGKIFGCAAVGWLISKIQKMVGARDVGDEDIRALTGIVRALIVFTIADIIGPNLPPEIGDPTIFGVKLIVLAYAGYKLIKAIFTITPGDRSGPIGYLDEVFDSAMFTWMLAAFWDKYGG